MKKFAPIFLVVLLVPVFVIIPISLRKTASSPSAQVASAIHKKVYLVNYIPVFSNGQKIYEYFGWQSPEVAVPSLIAFYKEMSNGMMNYTVAVEKTLNQFPVQQDGFVFTEESYKKCIESGETDADCHKSSSADYEKILNDSNLDICGKFNRGEIDELWFTGGPWFQFWESALAGPGGFPYNGATYSNNPCKKLMPIMTSSLSRPDVEGHTMGHRLEATMSYVYGTWKQNRMKTNWDKFALAAAQSPDYGYSGCGSIHLAPNSRSDYDWASKVTAYTYCDDFLNYPNISTNPSSVLKPVTCEEWGCTGEGFFKWWFQHLPNKTGTGPDGKLNNWWVYLMDPNIAKTAYPQPTNGTFSGVSGRLADWQARFVFKYSAISNKYSVQMSTVSDMSSDVFGNFGSGIDSPILVSKPTAKWNKYKCNTKLYWRVVSESGVKSPIQSAAVDCSIPTPTPNKTTPTPWWLSPTPVITKIPTPSGIISATPKPTVSLPVTTVTPGAGSLSLNLLLHGIGKAGDNVSPGSSGTMNPLHTQRQLTVEVLNSSNQVAVTRQTNINYNSSAGSFQGVIDAGSLASGMYTIRIKSPQYLRKSVPGIIQIQSGQVNTVPQTALVTGDVDNNNALSILDYNMILDCFADLGQPRNCADTNKKQMTDLTDDGKVNQFDYNLFLRELSVQSGQ